MPSSAERLEQLKKQKSVLDARIQKIEALTKEKKRKQDTHKKVLIGAYYLDQVKDDPIAFEELKRKLHRYLTRDSDRALFGLPALEKSEA